MALIKCPECGKEISDKSSACIHCGFPLQTVKKEIICQIDTYRYDLAPIQKLIDNGVNDIKTISDAILETIGIQESLHFRSDFRQKLAEKIIQDKMIPTFFDSQTLRLSTENQNILRCPKCGSTAITTGARGFSALTGFLGSGKTVNRCGRCGYSWRPKK